MAGRSLAAKDINDRAASVVEQLWSALDQCHQLALWLADTNNATAVLTASPILLPSGDDTVIRAALADLGSANGLWGVAHAQKTVASVNDFFFNAKKLTGINFTG
jgi:hypothetical protein